MVSSQTVQGVHLVDFVCLMETADIMCVDSVTGPHCNHGNKRCGVRQQSDGFPLNHTAVRESGGENNGHPEGGKQEDSWMPASHFGYV